MSDIDPVLRRVERTSVAMCGAMAATSWIVARGAAAAPLGVMAGGVLAAISYHGIKAGADALAGTRAGGGGGHGRTAIGLVKFFTRYAILAAAAYGIMARLRLPPVAVLAGASSLVVAVTFEALRQLRSGSPNRAAPHSSPSQERGRHT